MGSWDIHCKNPQCGAVTDPGAIDKLAHPCHRDALGFFLCSKCRERGYIEKSYKTQEGGRWKPYLLGMVGHVADPGETYFPFAFLTSDNSKGPVKQVWFCYYKDTRPGGRLKMGHGPGGPPVFELEHFSDLTQSVCAAVEAEPPPDFR